MSGRTRPIGVFDSGVGGLTVLGHIRAALPGADLLYVADAGHAPYGDKPAAQVSARAHAIAEFLLAHEAAALVVACNTATAAAIASLRERYRLPVIGMEPAVKPAAEASRSGVIGVLATPATLGSEKFAGLVSRFGARVRILVQPCPGLVERIEQGDLEGPATRALLEGYVAPLLAAGADTLVLGCTHYPLLLPLLRGIVGGAVRLIDSGAAVARQLERRLTETDFVCPAAGGSERFFTSGDPQQLARLLARLWGRVAAVETIG